MIDTLINDQLSIGMLSAIAERITHCLRIIPDIF